ncbi:MAG: hypothetical protein ACLGXA_02675 [Acidobacteriota bacterium]
MQKTMSIWFFAGVMFLVYGVLITGAGLWELVHTPANPPALYQLHAPIWWGALMLVGGIFYTVKFRP